MFRLCMYYNVTKIVELTEKLMSVSITRATYQRVKLKSWFG